MGQAAAVSSPVLFASTAGAGEAAAGPELTKPWKRTIKVGDRAALELSNLAGDVVVAGAPGDEIHIDALLKARATDSNEARNQLDALEIEVIEKPGRVRVRTIWPDWQHTSAEVTFNVRVPFNTSVALSTVSGNVRVDKVKGETRVESVSGNVTVTGLSHLLRAKSVSGDVTITESTAPDVLAANSVSGEVVGKGVKAKGFELQTVSGNVTLTHSACERSQIKSISGTIAFEGMLTQGGRYEFNSHSGDVRLTLAGSGFELSASSFSGDLSSELELSSMVTAEDSRGRRRHHVGKQELRGTFGDGGALVLVKTFSGSVTLTRGAGKEREKR
jgi:DUF4097 and DUF4098 domain-containing protein YvlB